VTVSFHLLENTSLSEAEVLAYFVVRFLLLGCGCVLVWGVVWVLCGICWGVASFRVFSTLTLYFGDLSLLPEVLVRHLSFRSTL